MSVETVHGYFRMFPHLIPYEEASFVFVEEFLQTGWHLLFLEHSFLLRLKRSGAVTFRDGYTDTMS